MSNVFLKIIENPALQAAWLRLRVHMTGLARDFWKDAPFVWPRWAKAVGQSVQRAMSPSEKKAAAPQKKAASPAQAKTSTAEVEHSEVKRVPQPWTADRIQIMEAMWGEGFAHPGGDEAIDALIKPLGLNQEMSVLDLGAGLGELARRVVDEYKCYVTGFEMDQTLATRGMVMSIASGKSKKATVTFYDPAVYTAARKHDCIIARDVFYRVIGKEKFFQAINSSLKNGGGQIVFTDYVLDPAIRERPEIVRWLARERSVATMTQLELIKVWKGMGYDLRIAEDQTAAYRDQIVVGLAQLAAFMHWNIPDHETKPQIIAEIDLWSRRLAAFHAGLKYYRFYGIKY